MSLSREAKLFALLYVLYTRSDKCSGYKNRHTVLSIICTFLEERSVSQECRKEKKLITERCQPEKSPT